MSIRLLITKVNFPAKLYHDWVVKISLRLLGDLDSNMIKARWPRHKRRQFWRDFISSTHHGAAVQKVIGKTIKKKEKTMTSARKTIESSILTAMADTALDTGLTISKSETLVNKLVECIFEPCVRWSVQQYLNELKIKKGENIDS